MDNNFKVMIRKFILKRQKIEFVKREKCARN